MSSSILADRDVNSHIDANKMANESGNVKDVKSMEYHRQVLQSKIEEGKAQQSYVSPSDTIMSPCTAKLSALRNKQVGKAKPKSLFAKTSAAKLGAASGENMFGGDLHKATQEKK